MSSDGSITFLNNELDRASVEAMIEAGEYMIISGDQEVLTSLPAGNWIAGTIPYFMSDSGGKIDQEKLKLLCDCIWNNFPKDGWERMVSEKLYNGEDIGWKIKSFSTIFESNLKKCKLKIK